MIYRSDDIGDLKKYKHNRDIRLPNWGPYSKHYAGIAHIMNTNRGRLMEFTFVCGYYGGARIVPNVIFDSGYYHWQADKNLSYYSYRYELEWKDKVFAELEFFEVDDQARLTKITFNNAQPFKQQFEVILITTVREPHQWTRLALQPGESWFPAEKYHTISHWDQYMQDGINRGVQSGDIFVDGQALGKASLGRPYDKTFPAIGDQSRMIKANCFGLNKSDAVTYKFELTENLSNSYLYVRYSLNGIDFVNCKIQVNGQSRLLDLPATTTSAITFDSFSFVSVELGDLTTGSYTLKLEISDVIPHAVGTDEKQRPPEFVLDGFILRSGPSDLLHPPRVQLIYHKTRLDYQLNPAENGLMIRPEGEPITSYGIWCEYEKAETLDFYKKLNYLYLQPVRELYANDFESQVKRLQIRPGFFQNYDSDNMYLMYRIKPLYCAEKSKLSVYLALVTDSDEAVVLKRAKAVFDQREKIENKIRQKFEKERYRVEHPQFSFSQERMMTQLLTNISFPVKLNGQFLKHFTPGKAWGGLYLWDAGFHALGLLEYSPKLAFEAIHIYFTEPDDPYHAFIMHGSPVPVPIHVYWNLYQRTGRKDFLEFLYPPAKKMYDFLVGKIMGSTMDKFGNGLLSSYDYFYNAAGWDDYPAQAYIHATFKGDTCLADNVACAAYPSHIIRAGKLMRLAAYELGYQEDIHEISRDIEYIAAALQKWSWDEKAGYFSYILNDVKKPLYYDQQTNFNMGLDGCAPLIADITDETQTEILVNKLKNPNRLWTEIGLSAVDQSAPYFTTGEGYWNGRVWMPYNWFFWKTMLTLGELDFANKIAQTCIDLWNTEVNQSYHLWENFIIETQRGAGCSQFGALSAPVIEFYNAYYRSGRITTGYDLIIHHYEYDPQKDYLKCIVSSPFRSGKTGIVVVMGNSGTYRMNLDGKSLSLTARPSGAVEFIINAGIEPTTIEIYPDINNSVD